MSQNTLTVFEKPGALMEYLKRASGTIRAALPKHMNPDRMLRLAVTCFSQTPALRECSGESILASIVVASQLGLEPGIVGQGYLIPYKGTCTFVPGWQGLVGLLNNTGRATAWTGVIYEGDDYEISLGSQQFVKNVPGPNHGDPDAILYVYACGKVNGSEQPIIECWPKDRVTKHRNKFNKQGNKHYSFQNFEMYARKVVLLQVLKYLPRSVELNNALAVSAADDAGRATRMDDGVVIEVETTSSDPERPQFDDAPTDQLKEKKPEPTGTGGATATTPSGAGASTVTQPSVTTKTPDAIRAEVQQLLKANEVTEAELVQWGVGANVLREGQEFAATPIPKLEKIIAGWTDTVMPAILANRNGE